MRSNYIINSESLSELVDLTDAEQQLLRGAQSGVPVVLGDRVPSSPDGGNRIRASVIRHVMLGGDEQLRPHPRAVWLEGGWIEGVLDLEDCESDYGLTLMRSYIADDINLRDAKISSLGLHGSRVTGDIILHRAEVKTSVSLTEGFVAEGQIDCFCAKIGNFNLSGEVDCENPIGLCLEAANIKNYLFIRNSKIKSVVNLMGVKVGRALELDDSNFEPIDHPISSFPHKQHEGVAVSLENAMVSGSVYCRNTHFGGMINLIGAEIGRSIDFSASSITSEQDFSIRLNNLNCAHDVLFNFGFQTNKPIDFERATIGGNVVLSGAKLNCGKHGLALEFDGTRITGEVLLNQGFYCSGQVRIMRTIFSSQFNCSGGTFDAGTNTSLFVDASSFESDVFLRYGFKATGGVRFFRSEIHGQFSLTEGVFESGDQPSIDIYATKVHNDFHLMNAKFSKDFCFTNSVVVGDMVMRDIQLEGYLSLSGSQTENVTIKRTKGTIATLDFSNLVVRKLNDDPTLWKSCDHVYLKGFSFFVLGNDVLMSDRVKVFSQCELRRLPGRQVQNLRNQPWLGTDGWIYDPNPMTQYAQFLERAGIPGGAAIVREQREILRHRSDIMSEFSHVDGSLISAIRSIRVPLLTFSNFMSRSIFGYGFRPARSLFWVASIWIFAAWFYALAYNYGQMAPNSEIILVSDEWLRGVESFEHCSSNCVLPLRAWEESLSYQDYETFNPWLYGLDLFVPLDTLGQETAWSPSKDRGWFGFVGYYLRLPIQLSGWLITALGAGLLTGLAGRRD